MKNPTAASSKTDPEANKALVRRAFDLINIERRIDEAIDTYFASDFIEHDPSSASGAEAMRTFFKQFFKDYPEAKTEVKRVVAEGDLVVVHFRGRMRPEDRGVAVMEIFRVADGRLAEHWQVLQEIPEKSLNDNGMF